MPAADQIRKLTRLHIGRLQPGINIKVKKIQRRTSVQFLMLVSISAANKCDICLAPPPLHHMSPNSRRIIAKFLLISNDETEDV